MKWLGESGMCVIKSGIVVQGLQGQSLNTDHRRPLRGRTSRGQTLSARWRFSKSCRLIEVEIFEGADDLIPAFGR